MVRRVTGRCAISLGVLVFLAAGTRAALPEPTSALLSASVAKGVHYLKSAQGADGAFAQENGPPGTRTAMTALAVTALIRSGVDVHDSSVVRGLEFIRSFVQRDGAISEPDSKNRNYATSVAIMCLSAAREQTVDPDERDSYDQILRRAADFIRDHQWDQGEGVESDDTAYGGAGYGSHERPDLSNTSYMVDALRGMGTDASDEAIQRALVFVSRCQNLESEYNQTEFASKNSDGGFYYTPAAGGTSQAGTTAAGGLRSYASMTYAGLRSLLYAGVDRSDPRVIAAMEWLSQHYSVSTNPGLGDQGLYYYYHTFAKTLAAWDQPFVDADGQVHDWRADLVVELSRRQLPNGSWVNLHPRWLEDNPALVTSYALLALSYCESR